MIVLYYGHLFVFLQDTIASLKAKMAQNAKESEERNKDLKEQREVIAEHFHTLKSQMNSFRENERSRLTKLTLDSNAAIKGVQSKLDLVHLFKYCSWLDTVSCFQVIFEDVYENQYSL